MLITKIKINNYRSIGSEQNVLHVEPNVTAIIGKNESGKTNVLEALGQCSSLLTPLSERYLGNINLGAHDNQEDLSLVIFLEFTQDELGELGIEQSNTELKIDSTQVLVDGGLNELITNDRLLNEAIAELYATKNDRALWDDTRDRLKIINQYLESLIVVNQIVFSNWESNLVSLKGWLRGQDASHYKTLIDTVLEKLNRYYGLVPKIYYRSQDKELKFEYSWSEIQTALDNENEIITKFLRAGLINDKEITDAFTSSFPGIKQDSRDDIQQKVKDNIELKFNEFYGQEQIAINCPFDSDKLMIFIKTDGRSMELTERSNGLRWYFGLFIDAFSYYSDENSSKIVFLLDEPGVHLHVNAQKRLLELFNELTRERNQLIYTTHSPYMIDNNSVMNVRAIQKMGNGNTGIYRNAYDPNLSGDSKMETLTPLVNALGLDLKFNLGPSSSKLNIITEGISDSIFLRAMMNYFGISETPHVIATCGASNIKNIALILSGWGHNYLALYDADREGLKEYKKLKECLGEDIKRVARFVTGGYELDELEAKEKPKTIESLIAESDMRKLFSKNEGNISKAWEAKAFAKRIEEGAKPEDKTIENFKILFESMGIYKVDRPLC